MKHHSKTKTKSKSAGRRKKSGTKKRKSSANSKTICIMNPYNNRAYVLSGNKAKKLTKKFSLKQLGVGRKPARCSVKKTKKGYHTARKTKANRYLSCYKHPKSGKLITPSSVQGMNLLKKHGKRKLMKNGPHWCKKTKRSKKKKKSGPRKSKKKKSRTSKK